MTVRSSMPYFLVNTTFSLHDQHSHTHLEHGDRYGNNMISVNLYVILDERFRSDFTTVLSVNQSSILVCL